MKMEAITQETRLLCRNHIDTVEQLLSYKGSLESEISELTEQRKGLYSQSRKASGEEKEAVKARLSEITERMKFLRKEVRLCGKRREFVRTHGFIVGSLFSRLPLYFLYYFLRKQLRRIE